MQVAVGEDDETAVLRLGILAGLLFGNERILVLGFGFENEEREAPGVEQEKVDKPLCALFEVVAERVEVRCLDRDAGFETNVRGSVAFREETPAGRFEQLVDLDARCGFLIGHSGSCPSDGGQAALRLPITNNCKFGIGLRPFLHAIAAS